MLVASFAVLLLILGSRHRRGPETRWHEPQDDLHANCTNRESLSLLRSISAVLVSPRVLACLLLGVAALGSLLFEHFHVQSLQPSYLQHWYLKQTAHFS